MTITFSSARLPDRLDADLRSRLAQSHAAEPFDAADPRAAARRATDVLRGVGCTAEVYRGRVELAGAEVDHVWLAIVDGPGWDGVPRVLDVAFPLFAERFVGALRAWVAGELEGSDLADIARGCSLSERVLGSFPDVSGYRGAVSWSARAGGMGASAG